MLESKQFVTWVVSFCLGAIPAPPKSENELLALKHRLVFPLFAKKGNRCQVVNSTGNLEETLVKNMVNFLPFLVSAFL